MIHEHKSQINGLNTGSRTIQINGAIGIYKERNRDNQHVMKEGLDNNGARRNTGTLNYLSLNAIVLKDNHI